MRTTVRVQGRTLRVPPWHLSDDRRYSYEFDAHTVNDVRYDSMSLAEVTVQAERALAGTSDAVFVMQVPSGLIIASRPAASVLLDPDGGDIVGRRLEEFTSDEPSGALALFADGRINGYESGRALARPGSTPDVRVSMWHKKFDHQSTSRFALVLITTPASDDLEATTPDGAEIRARRRHRLEVAADRADQQRDRRLVRPTGYPAAGIASECARRDGRCEEMEDRHLAGLSGRACCDSGGAHPSGS